MLSANRVVASGGWRGMVVGAAREKCSVIQEIYPVIVRHRPTLT